MQNPIHKVLAVVGVVVVGFSLYVGRLGFVELGGVLAPRDSAQSALLGFALLGTVLGGAMLSCISSKYAVLLAVLPAVIFGIGLVILGN